MKIPVRLIEFLNQHQVRYEIVHHPVAFTAQELAAIEGVKGYEHAKVVMAKTGSQLLMLVVPADHRVDWDRLGELIGARAGLAAEADFAARFPDCEIGTMPPFGSLYNVVLWVDCRLTLSPRFVFEAGTHSDAIKMDSADYVRLANAPVADFARKLQPTNASVMQSLPPKESS